MSKPGGPPTFRAWRLPRTATAIQPYVRNSPRLRGYDSKWDRLAIAFRRRNPWCRFCMQEGNDTTPADMVDHILPVVEYPELRYTWKNLQGLCDAHNKSTKARLELLCRRKSDFSQLIAWCASPEERRRAL